MNRRFRLIAPLAVMLVAAAIYGPWMNISGSVLASWWRKRPIEAPGGAGAGGVR